MKKNLLLLFFTLSITNTQAQTHEIDSLKQLLKKEKTDTGRVLILSDLAFKLAESKPDTAMTLAMQALELSRRIHYQKGEAISLNRIGNSYIVVNNYAKALAVWLEALKINEKINNPDGEHRNLNNIGTVYRDQGDYRLALRYLFKAKNIAEKLDNKDLISTVLVNLSMCYNYLMIYDSATLFALQSYNMATQINYPRMAGVALSELGDIYFKTGQPRLALTYSQLSFHLLRNSENYLNLSFAYLTVAKVFHQLNQKDSALFYAKASIAVANERSFTQEIHDGAKFLSRYYRNHNADSAFFYGDIAAAMNDSLFSQEKKQDMQRLVFDEKMRQQELEVKRLKDEEDRKHNLQYAGIAVALITFLILFFTLSRSILVKTKFIEFFCVLGLLAVFEFINLFIHPYLAHATNDSPVLMLLILIGIGALLVPLHHRLEKWITKIMVEKNKKIRLEAAKRTIKQLERDNNTTVKE